MNMHFQQLQDQHWRAQVLAEATLCQIQLHFVHLTDLLGMSDKNYHW